MIFAALSPAEAAFREEVLSFLAAELTPELVLGTDRHESLFPPPETSMPWQAKLYRRGWLAPHWEPRWGGVAWTPMQRFIFETEAGLAGAPLLAPFGLNYLGPVLIRYGSEAQKARFLPRILAGEDYWCQGYSEPNAGSDLANLQCAARRDGDAYVVNGTKLWTTHAHHANWIFCLVRTSSAGKPQSGISFLLVDLRSPGITVTPIVSIAGEHEVNQVFFDAVRVPADQLVGAEGEGWNIARFLLEFERGGFIMNGMLWRKYRRCAALAPEVLAAAEPAEAAVLRARMAGIEIDLLALQAAELRVALGMEKGVSPGPEAMVLKVEFTELMQRIEALGVALLGPRALGFVPPGSQRRDDRAADDRALLGSYLNDRAATIYGGSSEIQRELVARNLVGL
ncbi:MAG: acyl-CoA dehydrogenase family protein [Steroidobacteraceae bacterium]